MNLFGVTDGLDGRTGRTGLDAFYTPLPLVRAIVPLLGLQPGDIVAEPSAGGGAWAREFAAAGAHVHTVDIDPHAWVNVQGRAWSDHASAMYGSLQPHCVDFLQYRPEHSRVLGRPFDFAGGNPPFDVAEAHTRHALSMSDRVGFLLRGGFLASYERVAFWRQFGPHLTDVWFLAQRPREWDASYDYAFFLWDQRVTVPHFRGHLLSWR